MTGAVKGLKFQSDSFTGDGGRKHSLSAAQVTDLKRRIAAGERKAHVARELGVSRETVYQYLRAPA